MAFRILSQFLLRFRRNSEANRLPEIPTWLFYHASEFAGETVLAGEHEAIAHSPDKEAMLALSRQTKEPHRVITIPLRNTSPQA